MRRNVTAAIEERKGLLRCHPVYEAIRDAEALRTFMERHVLCVWDFMSLLKSLQTSLTCTTLPWVPRRSAEATRLINEIVLTEESDEIRPGLYRSHFAWYLDAMREVGCSTAPIENFIETLRAEDTTGAALEASGLPEESLRFTRYTLGVTRLPLAVRAAVFFHSREDVIARMFLPMVKGLERTGLRCQTLVAYLRRHVEMDASHHGPLASRMMEHCLQIDPAARHEAHQASVAALDRRVELWDATLRSIESRHRRPHRAGRSVANPRSVTPPAPGADASRRAT